MVAWGQRVLGLAVVITLGAGVSACTEPPPKPSFEEQRAAHYDRLKEVGQAARREALAMQRKKIADGVPRSASTPTEAECGARWTAIGEKEQTAGDRDTFVSICSTLPVPGLPGYVEAVEEAENGTKAP
ncbi:hypothetical protein ACFVIM_00700 [Streptomyces sp. NPDC057638]|uniref:hypothetical protein n=1 Tax=Streptomyces sp. NPDC057638 TaxID=3346190 RepID=UPI00368002A9